MFPLLIVSMLLALLDETPEVNVDLGSGGADPTTGGISSPVPGFLGDYLDEDGLFVDTPMCHSTYDPLHFDAHFPGEVFSEPVIPQNPEGTSEGTCFLFNQL